MSNLILEKDIEAFVCKYAVGKGLLVYKFTSPSRSNVPDRLFILPNGEFFLVEFKRLGGKPTPAQEREHARLSGHNVNVYVVDNKEQGVELVDQIMKNCKC